MLIGFLLIAAGVAALLLIPGKRPALDPRIKILEQYEANLMALIRERYSCTDEAARHVRRRFLEWEMDAVSSTIKMGPDGQLFLGVDTLDIIDSCALKIGLHPAPHGESAV
jgi:hypothetical protein